MTKIAEVVKGVKAEPRRVLAYGPHGIGKSTFLSQAPNVLVIQTEDGLNDIGCDRTGLLTSYGEVRMWLSNLREQDHDYRTVGIDSVDWLEKLVHQKTAYEGNKDHIEEFGFGKGYKLASQYWLKILEDLDNLRNERAMAVVLVAHSRVVKFNDPAGEAYDRYEPDLHKEASGIIQEWCDEVLFMDFRRHTVSTDEGFGKKRVRAVAGTPKRVIHTTETLTHLAKRRREMPDEIDLSFDAYASALKNGSTK